MNVRSERKRLGLTQFELSIATKIPQAVISLIDSGRLKPSSDQRERIAKALERIEEEAKK